MSKNTNSLTSHHGESRSRAINKMGKNKIIPAGKSKRDLKDFFKKKNRQTEKNPNNYEKLGFIEPLENA